jgi:gentisate 1,2-dioxygenase
MSAPQSQRREFYERLRQRNAAPLWEELTRLIPPEPRPHMLPALWKYADLRALLLEAGGVISAQEAERRVLILENPGLRGAGHITDSLYAGLQLVLPGETTRTHRHVTFALRFVMEGSGAYTAVEGRRAVMHPGDLILTPSWTRHTHANPSAEPVIWLDGLDVPIVNLFHASFFEHAEAGETDQPGPVFHFPYADFRPKLDAVPFDAWHGHLLRYPEGGYPMPSIAAFLQRLPAGFRGAPCRATDATVYCVVEGSGASTIGSERFDWGPHDVFVTPSWSVVTHTAHTEAVLFRFSDRAAQQALRLWREERLSHSGK